MSNSARRTGVRETVVQALLLAALLVPVFPGVFLHGELIGPGDLLFKSLPWSLYRPPDWTDTQNPLMPDVVTAFHPYYTVTKEAISKGEWPLWNIYELAGMPLLANCQTAAFYPPRLLHCFLNVDVATTIYILLKLWLCGMAAFWCARTLALTLPASRFFSVAWMLASYNVIWCNWSLPDVSVWLPVLFAATELILEAQYRRGFLLTAIGGALILLAGHPETAFAMSLGLGAYFVARLVWERRRGRSLWVPMAVSGAGWALALAVCAGQLAPFVEYLAHSDTPVDRVEKSVQTWLSTGALASFWVPRFFGTSAERNYWGDINSNLYSMVYPGMAIWIGAFALSLRREGSSQFRARAIALIIAALFGVALSFNVYPIDILHDLPMFRSMVRCYHIAFCVFALPLLGAMGIDAWFAEPRRPRDLIRLAPGIAFASLCVGGVYAFNAGLARTLKITGYLGDQVLIAAGVALATCLVFAAHCRFRNARTSIAALTVVLVADLLWATRGLNPTLPAKYLYPSTALTSYLQSLGHPCRIAIGEGGIASGIMAAYGLEDWLGYDGLYPERIMKFQKTLGRDWWVAMEPASSIAYLLNDPRYTPNAPLEDGARFELVKTLDDIEVYQNRRAFPRAFLVGMMTNIPDVASMLDAMKDPAFKPAKVVLTEDPPSGQLPSSPAGHLGETEIVRYDSTHITIKVTAEQPCYMVLADAYYPGWRATIDGVAAKIFPADYVFRGLVMPAGAHTVEYVYSPASFRYGMLVSVVTLVLGSAVALWTLARDRGATSRRP